MMFTSIIVLLLVGLVAGFLARAIVPGDDSMSLIRTIVLGVVGSFVGGFLGYLIFNADLDEGAVQPSGMVGSILGAIVALMIYRVVVQKRPALG